MSELPAEYASSATVFIRSPRNVGTSDWVICTNYGYLLEISGRVVVNNCKTDITTAVDLAVFYDFSGLERIMFYVVRSVDGALAVVRSGRPFQVVKRLGNIYKFEFSDVDNRGIAKIVTYDSPGSEPSDIELEIEQNLEMETDPPFVNPSIVQHLPIGLQDMKLQLDSLTKEYHLKRSLVARHLDRNKEGVPEGVVLVSGNADIRDAKPIEPPVLETALHWQRAYNGFWVMGLKLYNRSQRNLTDVELMVRRQGSDEFQWIILQSNDGVDYKKVLRFAAESSSYIIVSTDIVNLVETPVGKFQFDVHFKENGGDGKRDFITSPEFLLDALQLASGQMDLNLRPNNVNLAHDHLSMQLTHQIHRLEISTVIPCAAALGDMLSEQLALEKMPHLAPYGSQSVVYLLGTTPLLLGLLLKVQRVYATMYYLTIFASDEPQCLLFGCALKQLLPCGSQVNLSSS